MPGRSVVWERSAVADRRASAIDSVASRPEAGQTVSDAHLEITRRLYEYALGIDTRDWQLYRSIFTDEVRMDFSSYSGSPAGTMTADAWVAGCRPLFEGLDATQHSMTNPMVDIDPGGDTARCRMYMQAEHFLANAAGDPGFALGGYYDDALVRTPTGWRIRAVTLKVFWNRGNRHIMALAAEKGARLLARGERGPDATRTG